MKNKKIIMYIAVVIFILIILGIGYLVYTNTNKKLNNEEMLEYTPEEEITDEQLRNTIVTTYFMDKETGKLMPEPRQIDSKELLLNPYKRLIELLIEGPKNDKLIKIIPENVLINSAELKGDTVHIDFPEGFIVGQNLGESQEKLIINSIVNTLTELKEVNGVMITIKNQENLGFPDGGINFNQKFTREKNIQ